MLIISLVAILLACLFLFLEWRAYEAARGPRVHDERMTASCFQASGLWTARHDLSNTYSPRHGANGMPRACTVDVYGSSYGMPRACTVDVYGSS